MKGKRGKGGKDSSAFLNSNNDSNQVTFYNQDSCSNDTNLSNISTQNQKQNPIFQNESKIRNLLKELQTDVKNCQKEREKNESNLINISKIHEKLKSEEKSINFYFS